MKRGFTLVELSIVLVVVGLLIGGILIGQSMIKTAQINTIIRQFGQYDAAISNFRSKYGQLPGDDTIFTPVVGNNDGIIVGGACVEVGAAWNHLSLGVGLMNYQGNIYPTYGAYGTTTAVQCPVFNIDQDSSQTDCLAIMSAYNGAAAPIVYQYAGGPACGPNIYPLRPVDVMALDRKMDDGLPFSGNVYIAAYGTHTCGDVNGNYVTNSPNYTCILRTNVGAVNGDIVK